MSARSRARAPARRSVPNYTIVNVPGTLTITPAPVTVTANSTGITFGDLTPPPIIPQVGDDLSWLRRRGGGSRFS